MLVVVWHTRSAAVDPQEQGFFSLVHCANSFSDR